MLVRSFTLALCLIPTGAVAQQAAEFPPLSSVAPPAADPAMAELGYLLFFDPRLSGDSSTACSECHDPRYGWTDGSDLGRGYPGTKHWRNSQTIVNSAFIGSGYHWDAGLGSLLEQVHAAMGAGVNLNIDATLAEERMSKIKFEDIEHIHFAWAGSTQPGKPHYYRIQGKTFLIEFDNTQNDANHIHTVWRDFDGDFGRDLLREHYKHSDHH